MKDKLIKLAAEMVLGSNMPSRYYEDWDWPKGMQITSWREVYSASVKSQEQCRLWGIELRKIVDEL